MFRIGTASLDVTPPLRGHLVGYSRRKDGSTGVHDPLFARAIVFESAGFRFAWLIADLLGLWGETVARVREIASTETGIPADCIMVSTTHTHGGPDALLRTGPASDPSLDLAAQAKWFDALPSRLASCISSAASALEPATVSFGRAVITSVQHNRRFHMTDGSVLMDWDAPDPARVAWQAPIDPAVQVLVFSKRGEVAAVLAQFACHATVMGHDNLLVTADWPSAACAHLARLLSGNGAAKRPAPWVAFAQGCCGDTNPSFPRDTFDAVDAKGRAVAEAALRAIHRAEPIRGDDLKSALVTARLPRKKEGLDPSATGEFLDLPVHALRIGDVAIVGLPGEVFAGIGLAIKSRSEFRATLVGSYSNDYAPGYIPTASEYSGGYEVETSKIARGGDSLLIASALEALSRVT